MGKRGPAPSDNTVRLPDLLVSPEVDGALSLLVSLTGHSKVSFMREAIIQQLTTIGLVSPEIAATLKPTRTSGRRSVHIPE